MHTNKCTLAEEDDEEEEEGEEEEGCCVSLCDGGIAVNRQSHKHIILINSRWDADG